MSPHRVPHRSSSHRAACFALFRALLRQKNVLPLDESQRPALQLTIKAAFKKGAGFASQRKIVAALQLGYKTLQAFHRFDRQSDKLRRILEPIASTVPTKKNLPLPLIDDAQASSEERINLKFRAKNRRSSSGNSTHLNRKSVFDRPFFNLTGRRHVPRLAVSTDFPFLRIKKPQPPYLSRIIRDRIKSNNKLIERIQALNARVKIEEGEDLWDDNLKLVCGMPVEDPWSMWRTESLKALESAWALKTERGQRAAMIMAKMLEIQKKEQALADEERASEKRLRRLTRREKDLAVGIEKIDQALESHWQNKVSSQPSNTHLSNYRPVTETIRPKRKTY